MRMASNNMELQREKVLIRMGPPKKKKLPKSKQTSISSKKKSKLSILRSKKRKLFEC